MARANNCCNLLLHKKAWPRGVPCPQNRGLKVNGGAEGEGRVASSGRSSRKYITGFSSECPTAWIFIEDIGQNPVLQKA